MRKIIYCLLAMTLLWLQGHAQKNNGDLYSGYVNYEPGAGPGMITLISTGFGKKKVESIKDSYQEAFTALLFRGIPGSEYEFPLIPAESNKKEDPALKSLLQDGYMSFVTATAVQSEDKKAKRKDGAKGIMVKQKITINCEALRRHLEQNNLIRKFGI